MKQVIANSIPYPGALGTFDMYGMCATQQRQYECTRFPHTCKLVAHSNLKDQEKLNVGVGTHTHVEH